MVLATQNPIELEGTYPLPEAQLDRFMFCINVDYPNAEHETQILLETTRNNQYQVEKSLAEAELLELHHIVRQIPVTPHVAQYASSLIRATRPGCKETPDYVDKWVRWGAGTRAGQCLLMAAKAHVLLDGRYSVSCEDIRKFVLPVLRHRIFRNFSAASDGITTDHIINRILEQVQEPKY
jgi:MoxR-like ATPase